MEYEKTGAVIVAAGHKSTTQVFGPMLPFGDTTVIRRMIITLKRAGADPVVVITGRQGEELEKHLSRSGVVCLRNEDYETAQMYDSICMGIAYLETLCSRILILPVKYPAFLPDTLSRLMESSLPAACPVFDGRRGHPVMVSRPLYSRLLNYTGPEGLRGILRQLRKEELVEEILVADEGIIWPVEGERELIPPGGNAVGPYPKVFLTLACEEDFFNSHTARFLLLTDHTGSMQSAARQMGISYTKGWLMVKTAEKYLGYPVFITQSGGSDGGSSRLSPKARVFLDRYLNMEERLDRTARALFEEFSEALKEEG